MEKYKEILRYQKAGLSQRQTASVMGVSRNTVSKVIREAKVRHVDWEQVKTKSESEIKALLFPQPEKMDFQLKPDYETLSQELRKPGVTKKLLWEEYVRHTLASEQIPLQYSQFCVHFNRHLEQSKATMYFQHHPGEKIEVDWAGQTIPIVDSHTGDVRKGYLFVGTLPYSQYSYVEVTENMKQENWITAHVNMFHFFGGSTPLTICDNLKTGVIKHPKHGDVVLNADYRELADYYDTAIVPAKPRTPKAKASVESTVGKISTQIIATLRHQVFHSVFEANEAVRPLLERFNEKGFQKRAGSRMEVFLTEEKPLLQSLPRARYEYGIWKKATVQYNYHIAVDKMYYSVPYQYIKFKVDVRVTHRLIEIYYQHTRICSHRRKHGHPGQYATVEDHMPKNHRQANEWNGERFIHWAKQVGEDTRIVIERLLAAYKVEQQAYNGCLSILKLSDTYSPDQLEAACTKALSIINAPRYRNIKLILEANQIKQEISKQSESSPTNDQTHAYLRGSTYYKGGDEQ